MSFTNYSEKRNRVYVRKFDHEDARVRFAAGETLSELAHAFGVTAQAVKFVVDDEYNARWLAYHDEWQRSGVCRQCGKTGITNRAARDGGGARCRECAGLEAATSVRDDTLRCVRCRLWKPDEDFPMNQSVAKARRKRHQCCRVCQTEIKREYRERTSAPCSHGCGRLVRTADRRDSTKPLECLSCAMSRVHAERRSRVSV